MGVGSGVGVPGTGVVHAVAVSVGIGATMGGDGDAGAALPPQPATNRQTAAHSNNRKQMRFIINPPLVYKLIP